MRAVSGVPAAARASRLRCSLAFPAELTAYVAPPTRPPAATAAATTGSAAPPVATVTPAAGCPVPTLCRERRGVRRGGDSPPVVK